MQASSAKDKIKGIDKNLTDAEIDRLWGDYDFLRPKGHVEWLQHFISLEFGLARLQAGWVPGCGHLEWKLQLPKITFEDMQHVRRLRERLQELPGGQGEFPPTAPIKTLLDAIAPADDGASFFTALFALVKPAILRAYEHYRNRCDVYFDAPTIYILDQIIFEKQRQMAWASEFFTANPLSPADAQGAEQYRDFVSRCLDLAGSLTPDKLAEKTLALPASPIVNPAGPAPEAPRQDHRMKLLTRFPVNKDEDPFQDSLKEIIYHNATEWQVIDPMCYVFYGIKNMPLDFFIDFARHIWDECRHAQMGMRRICELGYSMDDFHWPHYPTRMDALEDYFAELTMVGEACSFTRKKGSIVPFLQFGDAHSAMLPEVDCVDERQHVRYGRKWAPVMFRNNKNLDLDSDQIASATRQRLSKNWQHFEQYDEATKLEIATSFAGFCGTIEFSLDFTVY